MNAVIKRDKKRKDDSNLEVLYLQNKDYTICFLFKYVTDSTVRIVDITYFDYNRIEDLAKPKKAYRAAMPQELKQVEQAMIRQDPFTKI